jgi:dolichol kinase
MNAALKNEFKRKGVHLLSLIYVFGFWYLPKSVVVWGLSIAIFLVAILESVRFIFPVFNDYFVENFQGFYRKKEIRKVSALIWTLSGALLTILIFDNRCMVFASFLYLAFGDAVAAIAGKACAGMGITHKLYNKKSVEGSLACFIVCFIIGLFLFNPIFALAGALVAAIVEAVPWRLSDNFWMQIANAGLLSLLAVFLNFAKW